MSIADKKKRKRIELKPEVIRRNNKVEARRGFAKQLVKCINKKNIEKGINHIRKHGVKRTEGIYCKSCKCICNAVR